MDLRHFTRLFMQRLLAPASLGALLWLGTEYVAFLIGGSLVGLVLLFLARPFLEVLDEFLVAHVEALRRRRRTQLVDGSLPFLNAYKAVLTKYPPALLSDAAPEIAAQLETFLDNLRQVKGSRLDSGRDPYGIIHATPFTARDFALWELPACRTWLHHFTVALAAGQIPALRRAVQHFVQGSPPRQWEPYLAAAEQQLDREAAATISRWQWVQRAQADPDIRQRLLTLLRLDDFHRQTGLQTYLASPQLQCPPHELVEVMDYIRYDAVAAKVQEILAPPGLTQREEPGPRAATQPSARTCGGAPSKYTAS
jgi:hypothetical protein